MARKVREVTIDDDGRDFGKVFVITEMPADQAERWATKALLALANTGVELPDGAMNAAMAELVGIGLKALSSIPYETAKPLLDEMLGCVKYRPSPKLPTQPLGEGINCVVEEVKTFFRLRKEVFSVHVDFFLPGVESNTGS